MQANAQVGEQIQQLRAELVGARSELVDATKDGDGRLEGRFDRLDEKLDTLMNKISFEPSIPAPEGTYVIDAKGNIVGPDGEPFGTLPAVLTPADSGR